MRTKTISAILLILCFVLFGASAKANPTDSANQCSLKERYIDFPNSHILDRVARGFNLPNWDVPNQPTQLIKATLIDLRKRGLSHIRLPVFSPAFMGSDLESPEAQAYMKSMSAYTKELIDIGYLVSIDIHPSSEFNDAYQIAPDATLDRMMRIWKALSVHLAQFKPQDVLVEILNEPDTDARTWQRHSTLLAKHIRELLPHHTIVLSPSGPQRHDALFQITPVDDPNTLYAIHFYDPFIFTHQGAEWLSENEPIRQYKKLTFPMDFNNPSTQNLYNELIVTGQITAANKLKEQLFEPWGFKDIDNIFDELQQWSDKYNRPIIINEFGVLSHHAPRISRLLWLKTIVERAEEHCMAWTHWDYSDGFGFVDPETQRPDQAILQMFLRESQ